MKNLISALCAVAALLVIVTASAFADDGLPKKMGITYVKAPLNVPSIVAKELRLFESAFPGVELTFPELTEGPKQTAALAAGDIAFASCLGSTSAILAASEGLDLRIIGIYSRAQSLYDRRHGPLDKERRGPARKKGSGSQRNDSAPVAGRRADAARNERQRRGL